MSYRIASCHPDNGDIWLAEAPDIHISVNGGRLVSDDPVAEAKQFAVISKMYSKQFNKPHSGRWYRVLEVAPGSTFRKGQVVLVDLSFRNHMLDIGRDTRHVFKETKIVGVLRDDDGRKVLDPVGSWVLLAPNEDKANTVCTGSGEGLIVAPSGVLDVGQDTVEQSDDGPDEPWKPEKNRDTGWQNQGIRVGIAEVIDMAESVKGRYDVGDMVFFKTQLATVRFTAFKTQLFGVDAEHVLGRVKLEKDDGKPVKLVQP